MHYGSDIRYFTWDAHKFPHSVEMINNVSAVGRKMVTIVDPHIKKDSNYRVYKQGKDLDYFVKDSNGNEYEGWCWPGSTSLYPSFVLASIDFYWTLVLAFSLRLKVIHSEC